jgi:hypothetical protein
MRKEDEQWLIDLILLNTFSILMDEVSDPTVLMVFLTFLTHISFNGERFSSFEEVVRTPSISVPVRKILTTPFFRHFSIIHYPSLFRNWGNYPLFPLLLTRSTHLLNSFSQSTFNASDVAV